MEIYKSELVRDPRLVSNDIIDISHLNLVLADWQRNIFGREHGKNIRGRVFHLRLMRQL